MTSISILPCSGGVLDRLEGYGAGPLPSDGYKFPSFTFQMDRCELSSSWQIVLLRPDGELRAVAIVRRRRRVGEIDAKFEVREWQPFTAEILSRDLEGELRTIANALNRVSALTPQQERDLVAALAHRMPWLPRTIDEFRSRARQTEVPSQVAGQLGLERDAYRTMLAASGYPTSAIAEYRYRDGQNGFADGLPQSWRPSEDEQILHDWQQLAGWRPTADCRGASRTYTRGRNERKLTVLHVNKAKLEAATGADLIYVNETNNALVLIQYKRMTKQDAKGVWGYPFGGDRLEGQLKRLGAVNDAFAAAAVAKGDLSARLHPHPSFIKLCDSKIELGDNTAPTPGMVLPLAEFTRLQKKFKSAGVHRFTRDNVLHSINSTLMIDLIKYGWVGTRSSAHAMEVLGDYIEGQLDDGVSVTLATKHRLEPPPTDFRGLAPDPKPQPIEGLGL